MSDIISCPQCHRSLTVPVELLGRLVSCPTCGARFELQAGPRPAPPPPSFHYGPPVVGGQTPQIAILSGPGQSPYPTKKPDKVQAMAVMMLVGGILATLSGAGMLFYAGVAGLVTFGFGWLCCLWPGTYYNLVLGVLAI